ncbi:CvpA family protein [Listeria ilorinensis]|uniref:CvpA family protein n=1 Tax=Listeria ilorinensis TaxID=2867439 RepID=UPI001EF670CF|nr:CvpA family protein [Listeria ilorinensis]
MILNVIIIFLLICGLFGGYKNGILRQLIITLGYVLSFFIAQQYYQMLAPHLTFIPYPTVDKSNDMYHLFKLLRTEEAYYNALAFLLIFIVAIIVVHMLASLIGGATRIPILRQINGLIGGALGVIQVYLFIFLILYIGAIYPADWTRDLIQSSSVAQWILENTPILSKQFFEWMTGFLPK